MSPLRRTFILSFQTEHLRFFFFFLRWNGREMASADRLGWLLKGSFPCGLLVTLHPGLSFGRIDKIVRKGQECLVCLA